MLRFALIVGLVCAAGAPASGHTLMTNPVPRNNNDGLKVGPCGNVAPTGTPMELEAGATMTIAWLETVDHPGYYRIAFSRVGDTGYDDNVLLDQIPDRLCDAPPCPYSAEVTLPDEECVDCSLQLIQYMGNGPPYSLYYSCADIALTAAGPGNDAGPDAADAGPDQPLADAGADSVGSDAGIGEGATGAGVSGGCRAAAGGERGALALALACLALGLRRRRGRARVC